jgi:hypothetical protein
MIVVFLSLIIIVAQLIIRSMILKEVRSVR